MFRYIGLAVIASILFAASASACDEPLNQPPKFVSLWDNKSSENLVNFDHIDKLCKAKNYAAMCIEDSLKPVIKTYPTFKTSEDKVPEGAIVVTYSPGDGVRAAYMRYERDTAYYNFEPDMYDSDWGYGPPYFHQTLLDQKGDLYKIPVPHSANVWVKLAVPDIITFEKDRIVTFKDKVYTILEVKKDAVVLRDEQPADMWCEGGEKPALKKFTPITVPFKDLYDDSCQLQMKVRYTRGC